MTTNIQIEKSLIKGKPANLMYGIVFIASFLFILFIDIQLGHIIPEENYGKFDEYASWFALFFASAMCIGTVHIVGRKDNHIDTLKTTFLEEKLLLSIEDKKWEIPYSEIKEVSHNMIITRYSIGDSRFRLRIIRKNQSKLSFSNPEIEWTQKLRFEQTSLWPFYCECKKRNIKCT